MKSAEDINHAVGEAVQLALISEFLIVIQIPKHCPAAFRAQIEWPGNFPFISPFPMVVHFSIMFQNFRLALKILSISREMD